MMNLGRVIGQARRRKTRLQPRNLRLLRLALSCLTVAAQDLKVVLEEPVDGEVALGISNIIAPANDHPKKTRQRPGFIWGCTLKCVR
jgi:hypothetical protein